MLTPTSDRGSTNRVYPTEGGQISTTNQSSSMTQDQAFSQVDKRLLTQVRQSVDTIINAGSTTSVTTDAGGAIASSPVHFIIRNQVVTLVGYVTSPQQKQRIYTAVQRVPGVVRVVDQLEMRSATSSETSVESGSTSQGSAVDVEGTRQATSGASSQVQVNSNRFGPGSTNTGSYWAGRTNQFGLGSTNSAGQTNNLSPTSRTNGASRIYNQNLPPGLEKREQLPPGLEKRTDESSTNSSQ